MRTPSQIEHIKRNVINPYTVDSFLTEDEVQYLVNLFESRDLDSVKVYKNTGPITLDILEVINDPIIQNILAKVKNEIGNFEVTAGLFFYTNYPHVIHNDDTFELPDSVYRAITLPLKLYGSGSEYPKLCMFDQMYFHGPAKFFKGETHMDTYFNKCLYEYSDVDGIVDSTIDDVTLFTHMKPEWLQGLSIQSIIEWKPSNAIIFDSVRLHCASDFRKLGYEYKLGLSIFTKQI
jgi:hypothetical protein